MLIALVLAATLAHSPDLYVASGGAVRRYHGPLSSAQGPRPAPGQSGATYALFEPGAVLTGMAVGPDGDLYVAEWLGGVNRVAGPFTATPGARMGAIAANVRDVAFGPDGHLYVAGPRIDRYDPVTMERIGPFTSGHALWSVFAIAFGPDGDLYVSNFNPCIVGIRGDCIAQRAEIVHFDGQTGAFVEVIAVRTDGHAFFDLAFGPDGALFATHTNTVLRFDRCGSRVRAVHNSGVFVRHGGPNGPLARAIAFGPDGHLYVAWTAGDFGILRYDANTGAFIDRFVDIGTGDELLFAIGAR